MSIDAIEAMVASSVRVAYYNENTVIKGINVREICRNLYRLQYKLGCGYTVLEMKEELEALGYLNVLNIKDLTEQDRAAVDMLDDKRFLKGAYIDTSGLVYVTYATEMWDLLKAEKVIKVPKGRPKKLNAYQLAKLLIPIAKEQSKNSDAAGNNAKRFLAYCYPYLPFLMRADECKGIRKTEFTALRDLIATPETFKNAIELGLLDALEDLDGIEEEYGAHYLENYAEPYISWRDSANGIIISEQELKKKALFFMLEKRYKKAAEFAARLSEPTASFYRSTIALSQCTALFASGKMDEYPFCCYSTAQVQAMVCGSSCYSVRQALNEITKLVQTRAELPVTTAPLHIMLARCYFFMCDWSAGNKCLETAFDLIFNEAEKNVSLLSSANVTAGYCQEIVNFCPASMLRDLTIPKKFLSIKQARSILYKAIKNETSSAGRCCKIAALYTAEGSFKKAASWLIKAIKLNNNNSYSMSIMLTERKLKMLTISQVKTEFKQESVLGRKYIKGLQLAYFKTKKHRQWQEFESVYHGAHSKYIEAIKAQYSDVPENLINILEVVDGTYRRKYMGKTINFYFLGSDLKELPYCLFSSKQIAERKNDAEAFKDRISGKKFYCYVDKKITNDADNISWLHFADSVGNGRFSQLYIDFSPSESGKKGQIVRYWHERDELTVIADSFDEYLQMLINENYNFIVCKD